MKNIIVIGGNRGVGYEVVKACLKKGYRVALACKEDDFDLSLETNNSSLLIRSFDLRDIKSCFHFVTEVIQVWDKIDGVVFYAGVTPISSLTDCNPELFDEIFDVNLKSTFFITQAVVKNMIKNGGGSIVFFGTSHMESGQIDRAAYAISKGGLKVLSEHLAKQYAKFHIRSNIIVMGWTPTEGELALRASQGVSKEDLIFQASEYVPMGRMLTVHDPIPAVMYFLSDESNMVTGSTLRVNGGEYI
jgi:NAD(P)-dependent dehydrogenase (short-subunit alcohol dehydrogenase family)